MDLTLKNTNLKPKWN